MTNLFQPLIERYQKIRQSLEERNTSEPLRLAVIELCECLEGIACGTTAVNINNVWPNFMAPIFHQLDQMLAALHNYSSAVLAILNFLGQLTNRILCYLSDNDVISFYNTSITILNEYARHNCGRASREASDDEESYNDILVILNFLNDLAAKDFIEWFHDVKSEHNSSMSATQVVFVGLNILMPLLSAQLLEFPKLWSELLQANRVPVRRPGPPARLARPSDAVYRTERSTRPQIHVSYRRMLSTRLEWGLQTQHLFI